MTYVKRRGMILLVDDSQVAKYTGEGFKVYTPPGSLKKPMAPPKKPAKAPKNAVAGKTPADVPKAGEGDDEGSK